MPCMEGMHAPGSDRAHLLPPAGIKGEVDEVYRFHRVIPFYPPDACVRPNEADLVCPPENIKYKNHPDMPPAGVNIQPISDRFAFHQAREGSGKRPCHPGGQTQTLQQPCPCTSSNGGSTMMQRGLNDPRHQTGACQNDAMRHEGNSQRFPRSEVHMNAAQPNGFLQVQGRSIHPTGVELRQQMQQMQGNVSQRPMCAVGAMRAGVPNQYEVLGDKSHGRDYITANNMPPRQNLSFGSEPHPACPNPYIPAPYICKPVYNTWYLNDCPDQDGPPADSYTFL